MKRMNDGPEPEVDLDFLFAEARDRSAAEPSEALRRTLLSAAEEVSRARKPVRHTDTNSWWSRLRIHAFVWRPAAVLAGFTLAGFCIGVVFAESFELVATELLTANAEESSLDVFSGLEQLVLEG